MILNKREIILAAITVSLLLLVVMHQAYSKLRGSQSKLQKQHANAATELERKQNRLKNAKIAEDRLKKWRRRSLPSDSRVAQSLYQNWLLALARDAKFSETKIDASRARRRGDVYHALQFTFQADATLKGLTEFLHRFYSADHLHKILNLTVVPEDEGKRLKLKITIEALSLSGAESQNELSKETSHRELAEVKVYEDKIVARNLFAAYKPPPPPTPPAGPPPVKKPEFDSLKFVYLTGVTASGEKPKVWIIARTSGKRHELHEGDTFEIDKAECKVLRIGQREAEIEIDGQRRLVLLGKNLGEAQVLSGKEKPKDEKSADKEESPTDEKSPTKAESPTDEKTPTDEKSDDKKSSVGEESSKKSD